MILQGYSGTTRLLIGTLALVIVVVILAAVQLWALRNLSRSLEDAVEGQAAMGAALATERAVTEIQANFQGYLLTGTQEYLDRYRSAIGATRSGLEQWKSLVAGDPGKAGKIDAAKQTLLNWREKVAEDAIAARGKHGDDLADSDRTSIQIRGEAMASLAELKTMVINIAKGQSGSLDQYLSQAAACLGQSTKTAYVGFPSLVFLLIASFFVLSALFVRPIAEAASLAAALQQGVLTHRARTNGYGEAARVLSSLNELAQGLTEYNGRILDGVEVLSSSATQIGTTASQLLGSASQTVSAVGETTSIVNEMEQTATVVNERAGNVADHSRHSDEIAHAGTKATKDTVEKISIIKKKMEIVSKSVVTLSENTKFVEHIIAAVQDLADQSNLLAVNASIEAARAGEHGKGFAVVAHEIKSLADQSRSATDRVSKILKEIRESVNSVVMAAEEGSKAVQSGLEQSEAAGKSIDELAGSIKEFSQAAGVIFSSSRQQFSRVERVSTAMKNVEIATSQSMAGTSHLEGEARKLEELGHSLRGLVQKFRLQRQKET